MEHFRARRRSGELHGQQCPRGRYFLGLDCYLRRHVRWVNESPEPHGNTRGFGAVGQFRMPSRKFPVLPQRIGSAAMSDLGGAAPLLREARRAPATGVSGRRGRATAACPRSSRNPCPLGQGWDETPHGAAACRGHGGHRGPGGPRRVHDADRCSADGTRVPGGQPRSPRPRPDAVTVAPGLDASNTYPRPGTAVLAAAGEQAA